MPEVPVGGQQLKFVLSYSPCVKINHVERRGHELNVICVERISSSAVYLLFASAHAYVDSL